MWTRLQITWSNRIHNLSLVKNKYLHHKPRDGVFKSQRNEMSFIKLIAQSPTEKKLSIYVSIYPFNSPMHGVQIYFTMFNSLRWPQMCSRASNHTEKQIVLYWFTDWLSTPNPVFFLLHVQLHVLAEVAFTGFKEHFQIICKSQL